MTSMTQIPEALDAATVTSWSDEFDVVVIGFGIAGGCAAVSAAAAVRKSPGPPCRCTTSSVTPRARSPRTIRSQDCAMPPRAGGKFSVISKGRNGCTRAPC